MRSVSIMGFHLVFKLSSIKFSVEMQFTSSMSKTVSLESNACKILFTWNIVLFVLNIGHSLVWDAPFYDPTPSPGSRA